MQHLALCVACLFGVFLVIEPTVHQSEIIEVKNDLNRPFFSLHSCVVEADQEVVEVYFSLVIVVETNARLAFLLQHISFASCRSTLWSSLVQFHSRRTAV